jgi:alpha-glucosidase
MFYGLGDKAKMNLKGKRLENFATDQYVSERSRAFIQGSPFYRVLKNKPMVFSSTIHLEPSLILS